MDKPFTLAIVFFILCCSLTGFAKPIEILKNQGRYDLIDNAEVFRDASSKYTIDQVSSREFARNFTYFDYKNYYKYRDVTTWIRFQLLNQTDSSMNLFIYGPANTDGTWKLYYQNEAGSVVMIPKINTLPILLFPITISAHSLGTYYLERHTIGKDLQGSYLQLHAFSLHFLKNLLYKFLLIGASYGGIIILMLYTLFFYVISRDISYLTYVLFACFILAYQAITDGVLNYIPAINQNVWFLFLVQLFLVWIAYFYVLFAKQLLKAHEHAPRLNKIIQIYLYLVFPLSIFPIFYLGHINTIVLPGYFFVGLVLVGFLMGIALYKNYPPARYYVVGMLVFFIGATVTYLASFFGIIPNNVFTNRAEQLAINIDLLLQSIALASRFNILQKEKLHAFEELDKQKQKTIYVQEKAIRQQKKLIYAYERFVPRDFLTLLGKKSIIQIKLGDKTQRKMAVLFADMRDFTMRIEEKRKAEGFEFINFYLEHIGPLIRTFHGYIDKYIGDAIFALFEKNPKNAVCAAIKIFSILNEYQTQNALAIRFGIAIHYGKVTLGTVGEKERMDGTVISDTVNTASRMEPLNKIYGSSLIISHEVLEKINKNAFKIRYLDHLLMRGKNQSIKVYEIYEVEAPDIVEKKSLMLPHYNRAIHYYEKGQMTEALTHFLACKAMLPSDQVVELYIQRCQHLKNTGVPADWQPIVRLMEHNTFEWIHSNSPG